MEVTAITNAKYYAAAGPVFAAPDAVLSDLGLLLDDSACIFHFNLSQEVHAT
jgi:hypothetical protein